MLGALPPEVLPSAADLVGGLLPVLARHVEPRGLASARESHSELAAGCFIGSEVGHPERLGTGVVHGLQRPGCAPFGELALQGDSYPARAPPRRALGRCVSGVSLTIRHESVGVAELPSGFSRTPALFLTLIFALSRYLPREQALFDVCFHL